MNINCYCIDLGIESDKPDPAYYWTNAGEKEFKGLLDSYLSERDGKCDDSSFRLYIMKDGYYIHTRRTQVFLQSHKCRIKTNHSTFNYLSKIPGVQCLQVNFHLLTSILKYY